ncbi:MAG: Flp1 family type IVb pilin [Candidatus Gastranaerophilales bacterium]|nr:Flp1 family type IVb pilin [Candidatus Gastranaerophilales bacterium]
MCTDFPQYFQCVCRRGVQFIVVLIGLVIIFKSQLTSLVNTIFRKITSESSGI